MLSEQASKRSEALIKYIESLFPRDHFPDGVPDPVRVTHYWTDAQAGQMGSILHQLDILLTDLADSSPPELLAEAEGLRSDLASLSRTSSPRARAEMKFPARRFANIAKLLRTKVELERIRDVIDPPGREDFGPWIIVRELGNGYQGTVYEVRKRGGPHRALKKFRFSAAPDKAAEERARFEREVDTLRSIDEPGIVKVHDADLTEGWMVMDLHEGPFDAPKNRGRFAGDAVGALKAIRPLVKGVAELHRRNLIHRDIKPANILVAHDGSLVLGDFGLILDPEAARLTGTFDRIGTRGYTANWVERLQRIEEWPPSADVYSIGKVLWFMIAGTGAALHNWYHDAPDQDLEAMFGGNHAMRWVNHILSKTVLERSQNCLKDAGELLSMIDHTLSALDRRGAFLRDGDEFPCTVCGMGTCTPLFGGEDRLIVLPTRIVVQQQSPTVGHLYADNSLTVRTFACDACGHLSTFWYKDRQRPPAWRDKRIPRG